MSDQPAKRRANRLTHDECLTVSESGTRACVCLTGYPGVGKYTVARELVEMTGPTNRFVLVDNHYTKNIILGLLGQDDTIGADAWAKIETVREAVFETIESLSPPQWSFVFTHVLVDNPNDAALYSRIETVAALRSSHFVPVTMTCDPDELARRAVSPERANRFKLTDPEALAQFSSDNHLLPIRHRNHLELDVKALSAPDAARAILDNLDVVASGARG